MYRKTLYFVLLSLVVVGAASFRLLALRADPPPTMARDFVSDEAWWGHNARNHALFGSWVLDDFNQGLYAAPLHTAMVRLSFMAGGVCLAQTRLVSALSGLVTIGFVGWLITRELGRWNGLAGMAILSFDFFTLSYDRVGFVEPLTTTLMTIAVTIVCLAGHRTRLLAVAGVMAALAYFAKANAIYFVPVPAIFLLVNHFAARPTDSAARRLLFRQLGAYFLGVFACFALWLVIFILPNWNEYVFQVGRLRVESLTTGPSRFTNLFMFGLSETRGLPDYNAFATQALLPLALTSLWLMHIGGLICRKGLRHTLANLSRLERFAVIWVLAFVPYFAGHLSYSSRRYLVFVVPMTILCVSVLGPRRNEILALRFYRNSRCSRAGMLIGSLLVLSPFLFYLRLPPARLLKVWTDPIQIGERPGLSSSIVTALATAVLSLIFLAGLAVLRPWLHRVAASVGAIAGVLFASILFGEMIAIGNVASRLSYSIEAATSELGKRIGDNARVIGGYTLVFGTKNRNLIFLDRRPVGYGYFGQRLVPTFRPTHLASECWGDCSEIDYAKEARNLLAGWGEYRPGTLTTYAVGQGKGLSTRFTMMVGEVTPTKSP